VLDRPNEEVFHFLRNFDGIDKIDVLISTGSGLVAALNYAFRQVKMGLVARFDSDDVMHSNRISMQVKHFNRSRNLGALGCQLIEINELSQDLRSIRYPCSNLKTKLRMSLSSPIAHSAMMLSIDAFEDAGGYREEDFPAEDFGLLKRIGRNWKIENLSESLMRYRSHESSTSSLRKKEQVNKSLEIALGVKGSILVSKAAQRVTKDNGHFGFKSLGLLALFSPINVFRFLIYRILALLPSKC
jgi:hypothetical protein